MNQEFDDYFSDEDYEPVWFVDVLPPTTSPFAHTGTSRIMRAIITEAIYLAQKSMRPQGPRWRNREIAEARFWIFEDKSEGHFSFQHCCHVLGWDAGEVRRHIQLDLDGGILRRRRS